MDEPEHFDGDTFTPDYLRQFSKSPAFKDDMAIIILHWAATVLNIYFDSIEQLVQHIIDNELIYMAQRSSPMPSENRRSADIESGTGSAEPQLFGANAKDDCGSDATAESENVNRPYDWVSHEQFEIACLDGMITRKRKHRERDKSLDSLGKSSANEVDSSDQSPCDQPKPATAINAKSNVDSDVDRHVDHAEDEDAEDVMGNTDACITEQSDTDQTLKEDAEDAMDNTDACITEQSDTDQNDQTLKEDADDAMDNIDACITEQSDTDQNDQALNSSNELTMNHSDDKSETYPGNVVAGTTTRVDERPTGHERPERIRKDSLEVASYADVEYETDGITKDEQSLESMERIYNETPEVASYVEYAASTADVEDLTNDTEDEAPDAGNASMEQADRMEIDNTCAVLTSAEQTATLAKSPETGVVDEASPADATNNDQNEDIDDAADAEDVPMEQVDGVDTISPTTMRINREASTAEIDDTTDAQDVLMELADRMQSNTNKLPRIGERRKTTDRAQMYWKSQGFFNCRVSMNRVKTDEYQALGVNQPTSAAAVVVDNSTAAVTAVATTSTASSAVTTAPIECVLCNDTFEHKTDLLDHVTEHFTGYACAYCRKTLVGHPYYQRHLRDIHPDKPPDVSVQRRSAPTPRPYQCKYCDQQCHPDDMIDHMRHDHPEQPAYMKYGCAHCADRFVTQNQRSIHQLVEHPAASSEARACRQCGRVFDDAHKMRRHTRGHIKQQQQRHVCADCGFQTAHRARYEAHLLEHRAADAAAVAVQQTYACDDCSRTFQLYTTLCVHRTEMHAPSQASPSPPKHRNNRYKRTKSVDQRGGYQCDLCGRRFLKAHRMASHQCQHSTQVMDDDELEFFDEE